MKIHILYKFRKGAFGGGNQFLKALQKYLVEKNSYTSDSKVADIVLFNSNRSNLATQLYSLYRLKKQGKLLINRIDGPISLKVSKHKFYDKLIWRINNTMMDGAIFQTNWSYEQMMRFKKYKSDIPIRTINNAPDGNIFYPAGIKPINEKIKIIASSWSSGFYIKGFDVYQYLDENLDFNKFEMTFVGNSPIKFKNINYKKALSSEELAQELRKNDMYITASINDPCSNSLIEALQCGLVAVVRNSGGHPELIGNGGAIFNGKPDVIKTIEKVIESIEKYKDKLPDYKIQNIGNEYFNFLDELFTQYSKFQKLTIVRQMHILAIIGLTFCFKIWYKISSKL